MPADAIDRLLELSLFDNPVSLGCLRTRSAGLQCRLFALVPPIRSRHIRTRMSPGKAACPFYEAARDAADEGRMATTMTMKRRSPSIRDDSPRTHRAIRERPQTPTTWRPRPWTFLQRVINGAPLEDADRKAIDDLLVRCRL